MKMSRQDIKLLNLTPREVVVLRLLEKDGSAGLQIHELSDRLSLPHSSLTYTLGQLYARNLVAYALRGRRKVWQSCLGDVTFRKRLGALESVAGDMRIVEGAAQIKELYFSAIEVHRHERVLFFEGNLAVHSIKTKLGIEMMRKHHELSVEREVILESIIGEDTITDIKNGTLGHDVLRSLARIKLWVAYVVPDAVMNTDVALVMFRDVALVTDWATERSVVINAPEPVRLLRNFCEAFVAMSRKVDVVKLVKESCERHGITIQ